MEDATCERNLKRIQEIIHAGGYSQTDANNSLYYAIISLQHDIAETLIKSGANAHLLGGFLLYNAVANRDIKMTKLLLHYGANFHESFCEECHFDTIYKWNKNKEMINFLCRAGMKELLFKNINEIPCIVNENIRELVSFGYWHKDLSESLGYDLVSLLCHEHDRHPDFVKEGIFRRIVRERMRVYNLMKKRTLMPGDILFVFLK